MSSIPYETVFIKGNRYPVILFNRHVLPFFETRDYREVRILLFIPRITVHFLSVFFSPDDVDILRKASLFIKINILWFCILCFYLPLTDQWRIVLLY